ncbi:hypothetical protein ACJMK2_002230 [Sinanodonta woodiana]|uniref:Helicase ATP-binding domain-containing protein n=1 Tax=Sinanodonta woodiana TaxID=1069815 RepID=A0ABD3XUP4_SINWO
MKTHGIKAQGIIKDMLMESIKDIKDGNIDVILDSPEAIMKKEWLQIVHQEPLWSQLCLLVFDEAHCISQW